MTIYIKYMVSLRCILKVKEYLSSMGMQYTSVELGKAELKADLDIEKHSLLQQNLRNIGFDLLVDKKSILIEKIKNLIVCMIHHSDEIPKMNYSSYISGELHYDYTYLSNIFKAVKGITIQQFIIRHKIEKVKELLLYDELSLSAIASKLHYSSVAHLSNQFKKITGQTPSLFKARLDKHLNNLESI